MRTAFQPTAPGTAQRRGAGPKHSSGAGEKGWRTEDEQRKNDGRISSTLSCHRAFRSEGLHVLDKASAPPGAECFLFHRVVLGHALTQAKVSRGGTCHFSVPVTNVLDGQQDRS